MCKQQELIQRIYDWHEDCDYEDCEIREAIKKGLSEDELIAITKEVDPDLFV